MEFIKLNNGWNAEPNAPCPVIKINGSDLLLSFYMNCYEGYGKNDIGILNFHNCVQFRLGTLNDEGFYRYGDIYKQHGVDWGWFYRIVGSDWKKKFDDPIYIENNSVFKEYNHYLFYFRDEDFECIATNYDFYISKKRP